MSSDLGRGEPIARVKLYRVEVEKAGGEDYSKSRETQTDSIDAEETGQIRPGTISDDAVSVSLREVEIGSTDLFLDGSVTIGRQDVCNLRPIHRHNRRDKSISRVHCIVSGKLSDDGTPRIEVTDMSMNASFLNDKGKLKRGNTHRLKEDSFVSFGSNIFEEDLNAKPRRFRVRYELTEANALAKDSILEDSKFEIRAS